ncbi:MAG: hypothetical protein LWW94_02930 [Candidatus Desulfofervidaceae bacterium]|nr:hypothetical protein [Candidatus Desulfofervidaceae bacterium]
MSFKTFSDIMEQIATLPQNEQEHIMTLFATIRPTYALQKELLEYILDIRARDEVTVGDILKDEIKKIVTNSSLTREQKLTYVRQYLRKRRFPLLSQAETIFAQRIKALNLPPTCHLIPPLYWEDNVYKITFNFKNTKDATNKLEQLLEISRSKGWQELINEDWFETLFPSESTDR